MFTLRIECRANAGPSPAAALTDRVPPHFLAPPLALASVRALLVLTGQDSQREEERTASVRYRWSLDQVPEILAQRAEPALDNSREHPDELSADFSYGYGRVFASHEHGAEAFHHDVFGSTVRTDRTAGWAQAAAYEVFGAPEPDPAITAGHLKRRHGLTTLRRTRCQNGSGKNRIWWMHAPVSPGSRQPPSQSPQQWRQWRQWR